MCVPRACFWFFLGIRLYRVFANYGTKLQRVMDCVQIVFKLSYRNIYLFFYFFENIGKYKENRKTQSCIFSYVKKRKATKKVSFSIRICCIDQLNATGYKSIYIFLLERPVSQETSNFRHLFKT